MAFPLGDISVDVFLRDYWQKKPLLIRQAFPDFQAFISPEELAGLACENEFSSRLILERPDQPWLVEYGPLDESRFTDLPETHWTLLITDVDKYFPEGKRILDAFRFIPDWRVDDLMVSYAVDQGSVGAHVDAYDVFLLQASGVREWSIETTPRLNPDYLPDEELRLLANFHPDQSWLLHPGDMLYLPPHYAHHGVAHAACMTCSIGFRSPSLMDVMNEASERMLDQGVDNFVKDCANTQASHSAELSDEEITRIKAQLMNAFSKELNQSNDWLGSVLTATKSDADPYGPVDHAWAELSNKQLALNPFLRVIYIKKPDGIIVYADSERFEIPLDILSHVQDLLKRRVCLIDELAVMPGAYSNLIRCWYERGYFVVE